MLHLNSAENYHFPPRKEGVDSTSRGQTGGRASGTVRKSHRRPRGGGVLSGLGGGSDGAAFQLGGAVGDQPWRPHLHIEGHLRIRLPRSVLCHQFFDP
jgi:hypothetical protein